MTEADENTMTPETLADLPHLAEASDDERFRQSLEHLPFGVAVAELSPEEVLVYVNIEFERLIGISAAELQGKLWSSLPLTLSGDRQANLANAIVAGEEYLGSFAMPSDTEPRTVIDAWSNKIVNKEGEPLFRLLAIAAANHGQEEADLAATLAEKDVLLKELQHRVKTIFR